MQMFISKDPIEFESGDFNHYRYVGNDPVNRVDPLGLSPSEAAFNQAAKQLGVEVNAIKAVYQVETKGNAFRPNGDPKVLFERHWFYKKTKKQCEPSDICNKDSGGYGKYSAQLGKLQKATKINKKAAYLSTSFGGFQIMGFNYKLAGYSNVYDFAEDMMSKDEDKHLMAFCNFGVKGTGYFYYSNSILF